MFIFSRESIRFVARFFFSTIFFFLALMFVVLIFESFFSHFCTVILILTLLFLMVSRAKLHRRLLEMAAGRKPQMHDFAITIFFFWKYFFDKLVKIQGLHFFSFLLLFWLFENVNTKKKPFTHNFWSKPSLSRRTSRLEMMLDVNNKRCFLMK